MAKKGYSQGGWKCCEQGLQGSYRRTETLTESVSWRLARAPWILYALPIAKFQKNIRLTLEWAGVVVDALEAPSKRKMPPPPFPIHAHSPG